MQFLAAVKLNPAGQQGPSLASPGNQCPWEAGAALVKREGHRSGQLATAAKWFPLSSRKGGGGQGRCSCVPTPCSLQYLCSVSSSREAGHSQLQEAHANLRGGTWPAVKLGVAWEHRVLSRLAYSWSGTAFRADLTLLNPASEGRTRSF